MTFSGEKAIYVQMADRLCDEKLAGKYNDDVRCAWDDWAHADGRA